MSKRKDRIVMNVAYCKYTVVRESARTRGWKLITDKEDKSNTHDVWWQDVCVSTDKLMCMHAWQRINHWPGMYVLHRKDGLAKTLRRMHRVFSEEYDFFPMTWILPDDWADFVQQFHVSTGSSGVAGPRVSKHTFIVKPAASCQGRGIFLTRNLSDVEPRSAQIAQRYIARPFLIDGLKFDLRIYVLITSVDPLRVWLFEEGLARFATTPYTVPNGRNMEHVQMHLTNYAINKDSPNFVFNTGGVETGDTGSKRTISWFKRWLDENGYSSHLVWGGIAHMINKMMIAAVPHLRRTYRSVIPGENGANSMQAFEILGLDVLLDQKLRPWLLEVNHSPSFTCDTALDREIKGAVIGEALDLLHLRVKERKRLQEQAAEASRQRLYGPGVSDPKAGPPPAWMVAGGVKSQIAAMLSASTNSGRAGRRAASTGPAMGRSQHELPPPHSGDGRSLGAETARARHTDAHSSAGIAMASRPSTAAMHERDRLPGTPSRATGAASSKPGMTAEESMEAPLTGEHRGIPYAHQKHEIKTARGYRMIYPLPDPGDVDDGLFASNASVCAKQTRALEALARKVKGLPATESKDESTAAGADAECKVPESDSKLDATSAADGGRGGGATPSVMQTGAVSLRPTSAVELRMRARMLEQQLSKGMDAAARPSRTDAPHSGAEDDSDSDGVSEADSKLDADDDLGIVEDDDGSDLEEGRTVSTGAVSARPFTARTKRIIGPMDHGAPLPSLPPFDVSREALYARQREYMYYAAVAEELYALETQASASGSRKAGEQAVSASAAMIAAAVKTVASCGTAADGGSTARASAAAHADDMASFSRMLRALAEAGRVKALSSSAPPTPSSGVPPRAASRGPAAAAAGRPGSAVSALRRSPMKGNASVPTKQRSPSVTAQGTPDASGTPRASSLSSHGSSREGSRAASVSSDTPNDTGARAGAAPTPPPAAAATSRRGSSKPSGGPSTEAAAGGEPSALAESPTPGRLNPPAVIGSTLELRADRTPLRNAQPVVASWRVVGQGGPVTTQLVPDLASLAIFPLISTSTADVTHDGATSSRAGPSLVKSTQQRLPPSRLRATFDAGASTGTASSAPAPAPSSPRQGGQMASIARPAGRTDGGVRVDGGALVPRVVRIGTRTFVTNSGDVSPRERDAAVRTGSNPDLVQLWPSPASLSPVPGLYIDPVVGSRSPLHAGAHAARAVPGIAERSVRGTPGTLRRTHSFEHLETSTTHLETEPSHPPLQQRTTSWSDRISIPSAREENTGASTGRRSISAARPLSRAHASRENLTTEQDALFSATKSFSAARRAYTPRGRLSDAGIQWQASTATLTTHAAGGGMDTDIRDPGPTVLPGGAYHAERSSVDARILPPASSTFSNSVARGSTVAVPAGGTAASGKKDGFAGLRGRPTPVVRPLSALAGVRM